MVSAVSGPTDWVSPITAATARAEETLRLQFDNVELEVKGMELFGKRLAEAVERSSANEAERERNRTDLYKLGIGQTMLSAVTTTLGVGAALSTGAGAGYAAAMVGISLFNFGHQCVTQMGGYEAIAKAFGGGTKEVEARTQSLQTAMGYMTLGASIAGFCLSDTAQLKEGWKFLTDTQFGGIERAATMLQAVLGVREARAHKEQYKVQMEWMDDRQEFFVQRLGRDGAERQMRLSLSQVEKILEQALDTIRMRQKLKAQEAGL